MLNINFLNYNVVPYEILFRSIFPASSGCISFSVGGPFFFIIFFMVFSLFCFICYYWGPMCCHTHCAHRTTCRAPILTVSFALARFPVVCAAAAGIVQVK